jgi:hypothetical protein
LSSPSLSLPADNAKRMSALISSEIASHLPVLWLAVTSPLGTPLLGLRSEPRTGVDAGKLDRDATIGELMEPTRTRVGVFCNGGQNLLPTGTRTGPAALEDSVRGAGARIELTAVVRSLDSAPRLPQVHPRFPNSSMMSTDCASPGPIFRRLQDHPRARQFALWVNF